MLFRKFCGDEFLRQKFKKAAISNGRLVEEDGDGPNLPFLVDPVEVVDVEILPEPLELGQVGAELRKK